MNELLQKRRKLIAALIVLVISVGFGMSYFMKPHDSSLELVSVNQELPDPNKTYPLDSGLADRITKSYGLALVLVISEYSQRNAIALDGIRSWARQQFEKDAAFLHNVSADSFEVRHGSIIESLCYSLFSGPRTALRESLLNFVKTQIETFHTTKAYLHFRSDYFDSFGLDREAALLLARYQSEKAKIAVNVVMSAIFWAIVFAAAVILNWRTAAGARSTRVQRLLAMFWIVIGAFYLNVAWSQNQVVLLVSAWICGCIGLYICKPFTIESTDERGIAFKLATPNRAILAFGCWATVSLVAIQLMTWIKTGTLMDPDPLTLLISTFSGNFLYDPASAKRSISHVIGIVWIIASAWAFREATVGEPSVEIERELASFNKVAP